MNSKNIEKEISQSITIEEVHELAHEFFKRNTSGEGVDGIEKLFRHPDLRIHTPDGRAWSLEDHRILHTKWKEEKHEMGEFQIMPISDNPVRVRAVGTLYWEAKYINADAQDQNLIKAIVGEDWTIERREDGSLCFNLYISTFYHPLPGSASIGI